VSFVPFSIGIILGSAAAAPLGQRFGRAAIATGAAAITLTLASLLAVVAHYGTALHTWQLAPSLALTGIAFGIISDHGHSHAPPIECTRSQPCHHHSSDESSF
jgi:MFS family permease